MSKKINQSEEELIQEPMEELKDVDELAKQFDIDSSVFAGVKMLMGWKKGKQLAESDFKKALEKFKNKSC